MSSLKSIATQSRGFTLIELIVVIAIMAVLAAITVPTVTSHLGKSREQSFTAEEERIRSALNAFFSAPENDALHRAATVSPPRQRPDRRAHSHHHLFLNRRDRPGQSLRPRRRRRRRRDR